MSDSPEQKTSAETAGSSPQSVTPPAPPAASVSPSPAGVDPSKHADVIARAKTAEAELQNIKISADAAASKKAEAEAARQLEELKAAKAAADARAEQLSRAARKQAAINALPGMRNAARFLPLIIDDVELSDEGLLTEDSQTKLQAFREENHFLFEQIAATSPATPGTTPVSAAGHRPARGQYTEEQAELISQHTRGEPGSVYQSSAFKQIGKLIWGHDATPNKGSINGRR